jgi:tRNA (guanine-N7-)-methyltransferase
MSDPRQARSRTFYGRRKGHKLRPRRAALIQERLPQLALDLSQAAPGNLRTLFPAPVERVAIEIGFGGGENLVHEAKADRQTGFIGCEPFINGMARALTLIEEARVDTVRLHMGDASDVLAWLPAASLARADLLYPDPWPKKRQRKRRFITDDSVAQIARVLAPGGLFRFATDIDDYAEWTLVRFLRAPEFEWCAEGADDWRRPWRGFAGTRYEAKAIQERRRPTYLVFRRC